MKWQIGNDRWRWSADGLAILFLTLWPFVYFFPVTLMQGVWFGSDFSLFYYPVGLELSRALDAGRLPFWTMGISAGFPLLAEGQVGALYPFNLILFKLLPADIAISYGMLLHLAWTAVGMYLCLRAFNFGVGSATLAGFIVSFNGFVIVRLIHTPIILTGAWLPWLIYCQRMFQRTQGQPGGRRGIWFLLTTLAFALQFLAGFPQIAFLNTIALVLFGLFGELWHDSFGEAGEPWYRTMVRTFPGFVFSTLFPMLIGAGIAAIQLVPTAELIGYSVRGAGANEGFVTSFSLPPAYLIQFLFPYALGQPSNETNGYFAYLGITALFLAMLAPFLRRDRRTIFLALFALVMLSLTLGEVNPVFDFLARLPLLSLFRVPPRYFHLMMFAVAFLSATAFEELCQRLDGSHRSVRHVVRWVPVLALPTLAVIALAQTQSLDFWLQTWSVLPVALILLSLLILWLAWTRRIGRPAFIILILALTVFDLACYPPPLQATIAPIVPPAYARLVPRSVAVLETAPHAGRVFSDLSVYASFPASRNSLMPNTALIYGKESAQVYSPLAFARHFIYKDNLSPAMLNLLNVQYFLIALEPRPRGKPVTPFRTLSLDVLNNEANVPPTAAAAIEVVSFTEWAMDLADGTEVARLVVQATDGSTETFPLRLGIETADWDYELKEPAHARAQIAHSVPAFWRSVSRAFQGHTYVARFQLGSSSGIGAINVHVLQPDLGLTIESVTLYDDRGQALSLAQLTGKDDFTLVFLSDTVAVWKTGDGLPRAFVVHAAEVMDDDAAFQRLHASGFRGDEVVLLSDGEPLVPRTGEGSAQDSVQITQYEPERVSLTVSTDRSGYLILTDSWYPGWNAFVDGGATPIYRADLLFRAVHIDPGTHTVVFEYRPLSFAVGAVISLVSLGLVAGVSVLYLH